jgi:hypothetical protein
MSDLTHIKKRGHPRRAHPPEITKSLMVHKDGEQNDDRQGNTQQPQ